MRLDRWTGREVSGSEDMINIPSPIPELDELIQNNEEGKVCKHSVNVSGIVACFGESVSLIPVHLFDCKHCSVYNSHAV